MSHANYVTLDRKIAVAPMLDWTDRHCRYFLRLLSPNALLYTEMVTTGALLHGQTERFLAFHQAEHPLALQLGGSDPDALAKCVRLAEQYGYDEVNLNVGCPSDRVQSGRFGACLMAEPDLVAECIHAMLAATSLPVSIKTRIGIDHQDSYEELCKFITTTADAGCKIYIMHARKAWLKGLSPKENREIPPLRYDVIQCLKKDFPHLSFILNGGINNLPQLKELLAQFDGVMIGRAAYHDPYLLAEADRFIYQNTALPIDRFQVIDHMIDYSRYQLEQGVKIKHITRHLLGLFQGMPHARSWRRYLCEQATLPGAGIEILQAAKRKMQNIAW